MEINRKILAQGEHLKKIITQMRHFNEPRCRVLIGTNDRDFIVSVKSIIDKQTKCEVFPFDSVNGRLPDFIVGTDKFYYTNRL